MKTYNTVAEFEEALMADELTHIIPLGWGPDGNYYLIATIRDAKDRLVKVIPA